MTVGIKEIAKDLNLGLSTVAQALCGTGTISPKTRKLVQEHAAKLGYTPNRSAQRMRGGRTGIIGLIVPDVVLSPYVEVVQHLLHLVQKRGSEMQIVLTEFDFELEDRAFANMLASRADGIIAKVGYPRWEDVPEKHYLRRVRDAGIPVVLYGNPIVSSGMPYMRHAMRESTQLVVRHLLGLGHRRFGGLVPGARPYDGMMQLWLSYIREELATVPDATLDVVGLDPDSAGLHGPQGVFSDYVNQHHPQYAVATGRQLIRRALTQSSPPTAFIAYSDPVAVGAIYGAQAMNLKVGRDIAIAGCNQLPTSFFSPITLTTVDRRPLVYAEKLLGLLSARLDRSASSDELPESDCVEPLLVIGESTVGC